MKARPSCRCCGSAISTASRRCWSAPPSSSTSVVVCSTSTATQARCGHTCCLRESSFATASHVIDAVAADVVDAEHLGVPEGAPLLRQQRSTHSPEGDVIEYHDDRYLPTIVSFTLQNTLDARCALTRNANF